MPQHQELPTRAPQRRGRTATPGPAIGKRRVALHGVAGAWLALLAACGGGGAGADALQVPAAPPAPVTSPAPSGVTVAPAVAPALDPVSVSAPATTAGSAPSPAQPAAALVAPGNWVILGSSTASGAGATTLAWADAVRAAYAPAGVTLFNLAEGATTTYAALPASSPPVPGRPLPLPGANVDAAIAKSPRLLMVSYPSNDTASGYSVDETVDNFLRIRAAAQSSGVSVIILSTQPLTLPPAQLALLPQIDARLSAAVAPCFVPVRAALSAPDGTLAAQYDSGDHLHPNDAGHAVIASMVRSVIDSGQCVRVRP